jgi:hypothetical protein
MAVADLTPNEIAAALAARRELGPDYEDAIAASLAERLEREITTRVDAGLAARTVAKQERRHSDSSSFGIAAVSLFCGIPITGIVAGTSHGNVFAIMAAWTGIALVNMAHALGRRHR